MDPTAGHTPTAVKNSAMTNGKGKITPTSWPADKVERRPVKSLTAAARNARTHSEAQVREIAASINEWGWTMPVLVDETGGIIAGHGRVLAAQSLGIEQVPVMVAHGWTDAQKRAYVIADNKLGLNAGWDWDILALEVGDLRELDVDTALMGFAAHEVASLLAEPTPDERALADTDPAEDATWPTLEIKMPPHVLDRVRTSLKAVPGETTDWRRLERLLYGNG